MNDVLLPLDILWGWLILVNLAEFITMGTDKLLAKARKRRIPEASLFLLALLGGGAGGVLGMLCFRHKTRHRRFSVGFPLILALHMAVALALCCFF
jgi:uncharacterized membrane protein YsdA (DUF1294 family)